MLHPPPRDDRYTADNPVRHHPCPPARGATARGPTAEQRLNAWASDLARVPLQGFDVRRPLEVLARGEPLAGTEAHALFNTLIYHEAYAVFVEAFELWSRTMAAAHAGAACEPFVSTLTLELPADWDPQHTVALQLAFQQIRVKRVEVLAPPCFTWKHPGTSAQPVSPTMPVPEAVNGCLATLLKEGATEFRLCGSLHAHSCNQVSSAIMGSQLRSIDIDANLEPTAAFASDDMRESFSRLVRALPWCGTLQHLALRHPALVQQYGACVLSPSSQGAGGALTSLVLQGGAVDGTDEQRAEFTRLMRWVHDQQRLSALELQGSFIHFNHLEEAVLTPLLNHTTLARLAIRGSGEGRAALATDNPANLHIYPRVVGFAATCPQLSHIEWEAPDDFDATALLRFQREEGDLELDDEIAAMANILALPDALPLTVLKFIGVPAPNTALRAFLGGLQKNLSLQDVELTERFIDPQGRAQLARRRAAMNARAREAVMANATPAVSGAQPCATTTLNASVVTTTTTTTAAFTAAAGVARVGPPDGAV